MTTGQILAVAVIVSCLIASFAYLVVIPILIRVKQSEASTLSEVHRIEAETKRIQTEVDNIMWQDAREELKRLASDNAALRQEVAALYSRVAQLDNCMQQNISEMRRREIPIPCDPATLEPVERFVMPTVEELTDKIARSFNRAEIRNELLLRLGWELESFPSNVGVRSLVLEVVQRAEREGRLREVYELAKNARPKVDF